MIILIADAIAGLLLLLIRPAGRWKLYGRLQPAVVAAILAIAIEDYAALGAGAHPIQAGDHLAGDKAGEDAVRIGTITADIVRFE